MTLVLLSRLAALPVRMFGDLEMTSTVKGELGWLVGHVHGVLGITGCQYTVGPILLGVCVRVYAHDCFIHAAYQDQTCG